MFAFYYALSEWFKSQQNQEESGKERMEKSRNTNGYYVPKIEMRFSGYDSIVHNRFVLSGTIWI